MSPFQSFAARAAAAGALALAATAPAQARGDVDVQWRVAIGHGPIDVVIGSPGLAVHAPVVVQRPVVVLPPRRVAWRDADRDGIPDHRDRLYNPRWDRDGDGVPNRWDRHDDRWHGHRGYERRHDRRHERREQRRDERWDERRNRHHGHDRRHGGRDD